MRVLHAMRDKLLASTALQVATEKAVDYGILTASPAAVFESSHPDVLGGYAAWHAEVTSYLNTIVMPRMTTDLVGFTMTFGSGEKPKYFITESPFLIEAHPGMKNPVGLSLLCGKPAFNLRGLLLWLRIRDLPHSPDIADYVPGVSECIFGLSPGDDRIKPNHAPCDHVLGFLPHEHEVTSITLECRWTNPEYVDQDFWGQPR